MKSTFQGLKYNVKFILESRKDKETYEIITEHVPIVMSVTFDGKRMFQNIGFRTNQSIWEEAEMYSFQKKNTFNNDRISASVINSSIRKHAAAIDDVFAHLGEYPTVSKLRELLKEKLNHPDKRFRKGKTIIDYLDTFIDKRTGSISDMRIKHYNTLKNQLNDFIEENSLTLSINSFSLATINDFDKYLKFDVERPRSQNTISGIHTRFKTFFNYAIRYGWLKNNPYDNFHIEKEVYGDPIFLTKEELDTLFNKEINNKRLSRVRDIFCLQCFIGARVSDFTQLKHDNIIDNSIQYIPSKTVDEKPIICKIPLTQRAWEIINRYDIPSGDLVPYISGQKYNVYLKELFKYCELNRKVTILNPVTRKNEITKLSDVANSHMARKTFVGILFKHTKNEVIASMSGHTQGSKAFHRYYGITQDDREDAIKNLE